MAIYDPGCKTEGRREYHRAWQDALEDLRHAVDTLFTLIKRVEDSNAPADTLKKEVDVTNQTMYPLSDFLKLEGKPLHELAERIDLARSRLEELLF